MTNATEIREIYTRRYNPVLVPLATRISDHLQDLLSSTPRIDRVSGRAKSIDRFVIKATTTKGGVQKYNDPLSEIQDQIGVRVITFYLSDVQNVADIINTYYRSIEQRKVSPERETEFSYFGLHYVLLIPTELILPSYPKGDVPEFFELQIKTLFQHAWSEAEHDLGYKPGATPLSPDQKRLMAFTSAQAWGADRIFNELFISRDEQSSKAQSS